MTAPHFDDLDLCLTAAVRRPRVGDDPPAGWDAALLAQVPAPHTLRVRVPEVLGWALAWAGLLALALGVLAVVHADTTPWRAVLGSADGAWPWMGLVLVGLAAGWPVRRPLFTL